MKRILLVGFILMSCLGLSWAQTLSISSLNAGANNVAASPLTASTTGAAVFGFSLTSSSSQTVTVINVQLTSDPSGKFSNWSLMRSTDANFATGGDNSLVAGISFTPGASQISLGSSGIVVNTTTANYFLVADVGPAVTGATSAIQASMNGSNVTVDVGTVSGSAAGTSYTFTALTLTISGLNSVSNNIATSPLPAGTTNKAVLGFSLSSSISQTVTVINVQLSSTPSGKLSNWSLVKSTDTDFASGGDNTTVGSLTFTPSATQVAITGLSETITAGSNYFLVADVNGAVTGATTAVQASVAPSNIVLSGGSATGSSTGTSYSFSGLTTTVASLNAGANNVALSPLAAGTNGQAVFGFSLTSSGSQTVTVINVQLSSDPSGKLSNWSLIKSTDSNFASGGDNSTVGSLTFTPSASQVAITGLSQSITGTSSNYFLVADVNTGVTVATGAVQASLAGANVTVGTGSTAGSATGTNYSFSSSQLSVITLNGGTTTAAIDYASNLTASGLNSGNSVSLGQFQISDGAGSDPDNKTTTLTDVTISIANFANVRTIAIFDGGTNIGEKTVSSGSVTFNGLSLSTGTDHGTKNFRIRATFKASVSDNQPITITITSVTADPAGSGFVPPDAGGATTGGGTNLIDVTADHLAFGATPVGVNPAVNFSLSVTAVDALGNTDVDRTNTVTLARTSGSPSLTSGDAGGLTPNLVLGARTWNQLQFSSAGSKQITASYTGLTSAVVNFTIVSLGVNITPASPVTICFGGDFVTLTNITLTESDVSDFSTGTNQTFYLQLPAGFIFDTSVTTTPTVGGGDISAPTALSYLGNTFVRFSYTISGTASIDHFIISGLKVRYPGTTPISSQPIKVVDASAVIERDTEADARNHGLLTAGVSSTAIGFHVQEFTGQPLVDPATTRFAISSIGVKLIPDIGTPTGGTFTGNGVSYSTTQSAYVFSPSAVGNGVGYQITYTVADPSVPHCTLIVTNLFDVYSSVITNLNASYCSNNPASTGLTVPQAQIDNAFSYTGEPAGSWTLYDFVYYDYNTSTYKPIAPTNTTFDPTATIYQSTIFVYGGEYIYYRAINNQVLSTYYNQIYYGEYQFVPIVAAPAVTFSLPGGRTSFCADEPAVDLTGSPIQTLVVTDDFFTSANGSVTYASGTSWKMNPTGAGVNTTPKTFSITYTYRDPTTGCTATSAPTTVTVNPRPSLVVASAISPDPNVLAFCRGDAVTSFTATTVPGVTYRWYSDPSATSLVNTGDNFQPPVNTSIVGSTPFYVTQTKYGSPTFAGCESISTPGINTPVNVSVVAPPVVNAGSSTTICSGTSLTLSSISPSITPAIGGTWTAYTPSLTPSAGVFQNSGGTVISPAVFGAATKFIPDATDVANSRVFLILTSNDPPGGPCTAVTSSVVININSAAISIPGPDQYVCAPGVISLDGKVSGATQGTWTTTNGTPANLVQSSFVNPVSATYTPTAIELLGSNLVFVLTTNSPAPPCGPDAQSLTVHIHGRAFVNAGNDKLVCPGAIALNGTYPVGSTATSAYWSFASTDVLPGSLGNSSPINRPTLPSTSYTPSVSETTNGTKLSFTLTSDDPDGGGATGPCGVETSAISVILYPTPPAPTTQHGSTAYCAGDQITALDAASAVSGSTINWYGNAGLSPKLGTGSTYSTGISNTLDAQYSFYATQTAYADPTFVPAFAGCESPATLFSLKINPLPVPSFTAANFCFHDFMAMTNTSTVSTTTNPSRQIVTYAWDFADGEQLPSGSGAIPPIESDNGRTTGTFADPSHQYTNVGTSYNVKLTATTNDLITANPPGIGCSNSVFANNLPTNPLFPNAALRVGALPLPDFKFSDICDQDVTKFTYTGTSDPPGANIASYDWDYGDGQTHGNTINTTHTYAGVSANSASLQVQTDLQCSATISHPLNILPYIKQFPYKESFESSNHGWFTEGLNTNQLTSWQVTTPNDRIINSAYDGSQVWMTNSKSIPGPFRTYYDDERSVLNGPCFDMTSLVRPLLAFEYWDNVSTGQDGTDMETSIDGGQTWQKLGAPGDGLGWYDRSSVSGLSQVLGFGGQLIGQATGQDGWSATAAGWDQSRFNMDNFKAKTKLRIRYVFGSNPDNPARDTLDGFAMDVFELGNRNRTLLAENFTNSTAAGAGTNSDDFQAFQSGVTRSELVKIEYHTGLGGSDPFYDLSRADADARMGFYGVTTPFRGFLSGFSNGVIQPLGWAKAAYAKESLISSPINIGITTIASPADMLNVQARIVAKDNVPPGLYIIHIALIEKQTGTSNKFILKKMLPDAAGTPLDQLTLVDSVQVTPVYSWNFANIKSQPELDSLAIVVFVQDLNTMSVIQAQYSDNLILPALVTGLEKPSSEFVQVYPIPAHKEIHVKLPTPLGQEVGVRLWDPMGKLVHESSIPPGTESRTISSADLASGVYVLQVESANGLLSRKKVLVVHTE